MKAITTKPHGAHRLRADDHCGNVCIIDRDDAAPSWEEQNHAAARELCRRMGWTGYLIGGGFPDGSYAWTFLPNYHPALLSLAETTRALKSHLQESARDHSLGNISLLCPCAENELARALVVLEKSRMVAEGVL